MTNAAAFLFGFMFGALLAGIKKRPRRKWGERCEPKEMRGRLERV